MSLVYVQHNEHVAHEESAEEQYGDWTRQSEFTVEGVTLDTKHRWGYDAVQIAPAVVVGDEVWVLYMTYGTGDSFGHHSGQGEILWVFTDEEVAKIAHKKLEAISNTKYVSAFNFDEEDGETLYLSNPANDYFSSVEGFHLNSYIVGDCPEPRY